MRVLLVDDQPDTLRVLSNVLIRCGAEIHTAGNATDALEILSAVKPDVLVSDIGLPGMDPHALIGLQRPSCQTRRRFGVRPVLGASGGPLLKKHTASRQEKRSDFPQVILHN